MFDRLRQQIQEAYDHEERNAYRFDDEERPDVFYAALDRAGLQRCPGCRCLVARTELVGGVCADCREVGLGG